MNLGIDKDGLSDRDRINPGRPYKDLLIKSYGIDRALKMLNSGVNRADEVRLRKDKADF